MRFYTQIALKSNEALERYPGGHGSHRGGHPRGDPRTEFGATERASVGPIGPGAADGSC
jgi:hypothetical protein